LTLAILVGVVTAYAGAKLTAMVRQTLTTLTPRIVAAAEAGNAARFRLWFARALVVHAIGGFVLTAAGLAVGYWLLRITPAIDAGLFSGIGPAMLGIGTAIIISRFVRPANLGWFLAALAVGLGGGWLWL